MVIAKVEGVQRLTAPVRKWLLQVEGVQRFGRNLGTRSTTSKSSSRVRIGEFVRNKILVVPLAALVVQVDSL